MAANVESMFYVRNSVAWFRNTEEALSSKEALHYSGLDWRVRQEDLMTVEHYPIHGFRANIRNDNHTVLGVVSDCYRVVQNKEAFAFTDNFAGRRCYL